MKQSLKRNYLTLTCTSPLTDTIPLTNQMKKLKVEKFLRLLNKFQIQEELNELGDEEKKDLLKLLQSNIQENFSQRGLFFVNY